jgi:uncharacterized membrane protein YeaQ/YmgE (transglycosylase-associated protein family)
MGVGPIHAPTGRERKAVMSLIAWIVFGLIAGFLGSKMVNSQGSGTLVDILLGIVGAVVGGFLFNMIGAVGVTGFNVWSLFVAVFGSIVVLVAFHAIAAARAS